MPSKAFPSLFWIGCGETSPEYMYPPGCEITQSGNQLRFNVPPSLGLEAPGSKASSDVPPLQGASSPFEDFMNLLHSHPKPLPPLWHAERNGEFANEPFQAAAPSPMMSMAPSPGFAAPPAGPVALYGVMSPKLRGNGQASLQPDHA